MQSKCGYQGRDVHNIHNTHTHAHAHAREIMETCWTRSDLEKQQDGAEVTDRRASDQQKSAVLKLPPIHHSRVGIYYSEYH